MEVAEASVKKSGDQSADYQNLITDNEAVMEKQAKEVEEMLLNMEKMRVDKDRLRDESYALKKQNN